MWQFQITVKTKLSLISIAIKPRIVLENDITFFHKIMNGFHEFLQSAKNANFCNFLTGQFMRHWKKQFNFHKYVCWMLSNSLMILIRPGILSVIKKTEKSYPTSEIQNPSLLRDGPNSFCLLCKYTRSAPFSFLQSTPTVSTSRHSAFVSTFWHPKSNVDQKIVLWFIQQNKLFHFDSDSFRLLRSWVATKALSRFSSFFWLESILCSSIIMSSLRRSSLLANWSLTSSNSFWMSCLKKYASWFQNQMFQFQSMLTPSSLPLQFVLEQFPDEGHFAPWIPVGFGHLWILTWPKIERSCSCSEFSAWYYRQSRRRRTKSSRNFSVLLILLIREFCTVSPRLKWRLPSLLDHPVRLRTCPSNGQSLITKDPDSESFGIKKLPYLVSSNLILCSRVSSSCCFRSVKYCAMLSFSNNFNIFIVSTM